MKGDFMSSPKSSVESQLRTKCNILESQVETLERKNSTLRTKEHIAKGLPPILSTGIIDDLPFKMKTDQWKEIEGVGKFPK